ncbi:hypothetical protein NX059_000713 [Plenodomus lindquistii]|nr:hypothetical protein NX059_000713 [Plenodomus lindquistii]
MSVQACTPATFSPSIFGAQVLQLEANYVSNYSAIDPVANATASNIDFCNITVSYTHPGQGDVVHVETWLPTSGWNRRLLSPGGGGYAAGRGYFYGAMAVAAQQGFGTVQTDAGFYSGVFPPADTMANLTLTSPGNLNLRSFINLASVSLQDEALFAKALMKDFYGSEPDYSYWEGCSQGGRQAMMLAQRFPDLYDGIISGAPAIYWSSMFPAIQWPAQVMNMLDYYPQACELDAMVNATRRLCDGVDGIIDGVLSEPEACRSIANPMQFVGQTADCTAYNYPNITITTQAATILKAYLDGYKTADGKQIYPLFEPGVDATGNLDGFYQAVLLTTNCTVNGTACTGPVPNPIGETWLRYYVQKDPYFDVNNLTHEQYDTIAYYGKQQWASVIDTVDTDLSRLRKSGAKLIHYHGLVSTPVRFSEALTSMVLHALTQFCELIGGLHNFSTSLTKLFQQRDSDNGQRLRLLPLLSSSRP